MLYHDHKIIAGLIFDRAKKHRGKSQIVQEELNKERSKSILPNIYIKPPYNDKWPLPGDYSDE